MIKTLSAAAILWVAASFGAFVADRQPVIFVFGATAADTLAGAYGGSLVPDLRDAGYDVRSLDLPCHAPGESGLECWGQRVSTKGGEAIFDEFCGRVGDAISGLGVQRVQFAGVSRGAFVAAYCGARDPRVSEVGMIAPVTDLGQLSEFSGVQVPAGLSAGLLADMLKNTNVYVRIGRADDRVGTEAAVSFAALAGAKIDVVDAEGHAAPDPEGKMLAWLISQWDSPAATQN